MEEKGLVIYQIPLVIFSLCIGVFISIFSPSLIHGSYIIIGLFLLILLVYLGVTYRSAMFLFVLFSSFGIMNMSIKPFDLLFVLIAGLFFIGKKQKLIMLRKIRFVHYGLLMFLLVSMLSIIGSMNINLGISYFIHTVFMVIIFYFLAMMIREKWEFNAIIWGYICTVLFSVIAVFAEKFGFIGYIGTWFQGVRAQGFFMDPNDFSPFLILAIFLLMERAFTYHYTTFSYFAYISLSVLVIITLLAAMSRAALLNFGIVMIIYFFYTILYKKRYGQVVLFLGAMIVLAALTLIVAGDSITNYLSIRFSNTSNVTVLQQYDTDRFFYQLQGIFLGSSHLLGIGPGQFEYYYGYATHNLFVRIIAENGWLAFLLFVSVLLYFFFQLFILRKREVWNLPIYLFLSVFIGIMLNSMFIDTLHWRYLWFFLGLCAVVLNQAGRET